MDEFHLPLPREEFTDIRIEPDGNWYAKNIRIKNKKILHYFKCNLHRDKKGIYIFNQFGQFSEKAYIKINGPLLFVTDISSGRFILENGNFVQKSKASIVLSKEMLLYLNLTELNAYAVFDLRTSEKFSDMLKESKENFFWGDKKIPILDNIQWS